MAHKAASRRRTKRRATTQSVSTPEAGSDTVVKSQQQYARKLKVLREKNILETRDLQAISSALNIALGTLLAFHDLLTHADEAEVPPKTKAKRRPATSLRSLASKYLKGVKFDDIHPLTQVMPTLELEIMLHRFVESGIGKPIPGYKHMIEMPDFELVKQRFRRGRYHRIGAQGISYEQHYGLIITPSEEEDLPPFLILQGADEQGTSYAIIYHKLPMDDVERLYEWFRTKRGELSPFRGQLCIFQSRSISFVESPRRTSWTEIVPQQEVHDEFAKCLHMMVNAQQYRNKGLPVRQGIILTGPPGTGKTVHLQSFVSEVIDANLPVFQVMSGVSSDTLAYVYQLAEHAGPALVILEDIDTISAQREDEYGHYGSIGMLSALLAVLDGSEKRDGVITVATTNAPEAIDRALAARPGRFDRLFQFTYLPPDQRIKILNLHATQNGLDFDPGLFLKERNGDDTVSWVLTADGVTPAHLAEAVNSVARDLTRDESTEPEVAFVSALQQLKSLVNPDRRFSTTSTKSVAGFSALTDER